MLVKFENIKLDVHPNESHEWLLETSLVAKGYDLDADHIKKALQRRSEDLIEGKHWIELGEELSPIKKKVGRPTRIFWTKKGVVRLGFFLRCEKAKEFRDWAEDLIVNAGKSKSVANEKAMELANELVKENETLKEQLQVLTENQNLLGSEGFAASFYDINNIKMYRTISQFLESHKIFLDKLTVIRLSNEAKEISKRDSLPVMYAPSKVYKKVNLYHESAIRAAYFMLTDEWLS